MIWNYQLIVIVILSFMAMFYNVEAYPVFYNEPADYNYIEFHNPTQNIKNKISSEGIEVGYYAYDIALNQLTERAYVTNYFSNNVSVIDTSLNRVVKNITVDTIPGLFDEPTKSLPKNIAVNPNTDLVYMTSEDSLNLSVIDGNSYRVVKNITVGRGGVLTDVAVNPNTNRIYVTSLGSPPVSVIDGNTNRVIANISIVDGPASIAINPINNTVYVAGGPNVVHVIDGDTNRLLKNITVDAPENLAINSNTGIIYVASSTNNRVYAIDGYTNKVNETIVTGNNSYSIGNFAVVAVNPTTDTVYVTNPDSNTVSIIDGKTNSVEKTVKVGNSITSLAVNPTTNKVYITNWDSNTVSIIDGKTNSVVADTRSVDDRSTQEIVVAGISVGNITVDRNPTDIAVNPKTNLLYISYLYDDVVDVIDELTLDIVKKFEEFHLPSNIDINPTTGKVYVTTWFGEFTQVIVINGYTHELIDQIPIGGSASDIAVNIDSGLAYVTNTDHNILSVINPHTNKLTAVIRYNINPSNSGTIECNGQNIKNNHIRYDVGTPLECRANPSTGFEFSSWSSDLISNLKDDNPINFAASKHGTLIANFIAPVQISVPWELIVGIIVSPIVGWFIPFFADRFRERSQRNIASEYITSIDAARKKNDTATLYRLKDEIQKKFAAGKIAESHYNMLEDRLK